MKHYTKALALQEWLWYALEADGALGLKAQNYEQCARSTGTDTASRMADDMITKRIEHVARERTVRLAIDRLRLTDITAYRTLLAYAGKRSAPKWVLSTWPEIGAVAAITPSYVEAWEGRKLSRLREGKGTNSLVKIAILVEGRRLLDKASIALARTMSEVAKGECDD